MTDPEVAAASDPEMAAAADWEIAAAVGPEMARACQAAVRVGGVSGTAVTAVKEEGGDGLEGGAGPMPMGPVRASATLAAVRAEYKETIAFADKKLQVSQAGNRSAATEMGV